MDLKGSLVDTNLRIVPTDQLKEFFKTIKTCDNLPHNILNIIKATSKETCQSYTNNEIKTVHLTSSDLKNIKLIKNIYNSTAKDSDCELTNIGEKETSKITGNESDKDSKDEKSSQEKSSGKASKENLGLIDESKDCFLVVSDLDWLYDYIKCKRNEGDRNIPYLHTLLEGIQVDLPENRIMKRNPDLEARCVKLRAQQEAREYRKMTKGVDNVRMRFPEDSISYQLKQVNRQLIAVGQFIISIFAGFLFGFRGVEWMVGNLDFGFRLLLGVMCALVIALAEIYFLAKKLNEELCVPETVQLGGPPKFADDEKVYENTKKLIEKEHQD